MYRFLNKDLSFPLKWPSFQFLKDISYVTKNLKLLLKKCIFVANIVKTSVLLFEIGVDPARAPTTAHTKNGHWDGPCTECAPIIPQKRKTYASRKGDFKSCGKTLLFFQRIISLYINEIQCHFIYQRIWNELNNLLTKSFDKNIID